MSVIMMPVADCTACTANKNIVATFNSAGSTFWHCVV